MKTLGIDPGTAIVGYGVVEERPDGALVTHTYGVIRTTPDQPMPERLLTIYDSIGLLIDEYQPERAAIEELFFGKNVNTAITVSQGRGVILLALVQRKVPIYEYKPASIKQTIAGYGSAKKPQMQEMIRLLLGLETIPKPDDAADGLAIAITDLQHARYTALE